MHFVRRISAVLTCALVGLLGLTTPPASAQQTQPPASSTERSSEQIQAELMTIQQELSAIEDRAMQDPQLVKQRTELEAELERALNAADPEYSKKVERMEALVQEIHAKSEADAGEEELMPLVMEGQQLQQDLQAAQAQVLESAAMTQRIERFHEQVKVKMIEIEPRTDGLIDRADRLLVELQQLHGS